MRLWLGHESKMGCTYTISLDDIALGRPTFSFSNGFVKEAVKHCQSSNLEADGLDANSGESGHGDQAFDDKVLVHKGNVWTEVEALRVETEELTRVEIIGIFSFTKIVATEMPLSLSFE